MEDVLSLVPVFCSRFLQPVEPPRSHHEPRPDHGRMP